MSTATLSSPATAPMTGPPRGGVLTGHAINDLLTTAEAAALLDCSARHIARLCQWGELVACKVGTDWRIDPAVLAGYTFTPPGRPRLATPRSHYNQQRRHERYVQQQTRGQS